MRGQWRTARLAPLLTVAGAVACALFGGVALEDLPASPIAIHYRTAEQARKNAEALAAAAKVPRPVGGPQVVGSKANLQADLDTLGTYLSEVLGLQPPSQPRHRGRLALLDPRTGDVEVVASAIPGAMPLAWSADRVRLLFAQTPAPEGYDVQIFEWDREKQTVRRVTWGPPVHTEACYGPEGRIVATAVAVDRATQRSWIRISDTGGRGPWRDLSPGPADHSPTCAADGGAIAFARALEGGRSELYAMTAPFDEPARRLAPGYHPRFAGEGEWIVYTARRARTTRLARIRPDGSGRAPVGNDEADESWPAPSPDGGYVAFVASEDIGEELPRRRLLVRRFDGSGDRVLLTSGEAEHPVW